MWYVMVLLAILIMFMLFRLIDQTSDEYLSVALNKLSKYMKISEALTGVTLLAFANGAPDIVTSMVAGTDEGGTAISIGGLYGASLFVTNVVFARCVNLTKKAELLVVRKFFVRDVMVFWVATTALLVMSFFDVPIYIVSIMLITLYISHVVIVVIQEIMESKARKRALPPIEEPLTGEDK
jgi:sodium/potassium/calcium exchanger 6